MYNSSKSDSGCQVIELVERFNNRSIVAYSEIYTLFYSELKHFASKLYKGTSVDACDVIHDVYLNIWQSKKRDFQSLINIKSYLYVSVKNGFKDFLGHNTYIDKYQKDFLDNDDLFLIEIMESEVYSTVNQAIDLLPEECALTFRLHIEGWSIKEISEKLHKSERTIHSRKSEAIEMLKRKIDTDKLFMLLTLLG